jgi:hypothetical protein
MIHNELLQTYIRIGRNELPTDKIPQNLINTYEATRFANWDDFSNEEIIFLFRGVVISERLYRDGLGCGSASPAIQIYQVIRDRGLDNDYKLGDWAFQYSVNEYIPLGFGNRHGASTIYDYLEWKRNR